MRTVKEFDVNDYKVVQCKDCFKFVKKFKAGMYPNGKDFKWCDDQGRLFNGKMCPTCHSNKQIQNVKIRSSRKKTDKLLKRSKANGNSQL